jgi:CheY-like chemotaxis protein
MLGNFFGGSTFELSSLERAIQRASKAMLMEQRILIVEDEPLVAMSLKEMVDEWFTANVVVEPSVAAAKKALRGPFDFAFLDVQVTNGKTFEIAHMLERKSVPFVFVSASPQNQLPSDLHTVPFISKPFSSAQIERVLRALP